MVSNLYKFRFSIRVLFFVVSALQTNLVLGQYHNHFYCGHELHMESNEQLYPGYRQRVADYFNFIQEQIKRYPEAARSNETLKIPVVVHVVWKNEEENLSDEMIKSQIDVLNEDFRLLNPNRDSIRGQFKQRQADSGIEFELAMVKRVKTNANFNLSLTGLVDNVKRTANGGSKAEDPKKFLNIWVCKIQPIPLIGGQILGYAYPPAGLSNWPDGVAAPSPELDGVVIDFRSFGKNNPHPVVVNGVTLYSEGRTATHEVGHYLGLRHVWGDGGVIFGGLSCNEDDGIADTPNQGRQSPFDCNKTQNTCKDGTDDEPDMIENYMDYSDQLCQCAFTKGQIEHMRMVILTKRSGLLSNSQDIVVSQDKIIISPNPAGNFITIRHSLHSKDESVQVKISDMHGIQVYAGMTGGGTVHTLDISGLMQGMYILEITDGDKIVSTRFVRQ